MTRDHGVSSECPKQSKPGSNVLFGRSRSVWISVNVLHQRAGSARSESTVLLQKSNQRLRARGAVKVSVKTVFPKHLRRKKVALLQQIAGKLARRLVLKRNSAPMVGHDALHRELQEKHLLAFKCVLQKVPEFARVLLLCPSQRVRHHLIRHFFTGTLLVHNQTQHRLNRLGLSPVFGALKDPEIKRIDVQRRQFIILLAI